MNALSATAINSAHVKRILVRSTDGIGDAVMAFPFMQRLRELEPDAHIAVLCQAHIQDLWQRNPYLNEVIGFDRTPDIRALRRCRFDLAVLLSGAFRPAWECWRAGIPRRVGFAGHHRRRLLTDVVLESHSEQPVPRQLTVAGITFAAAHYPTPRHQAHRYLDLISHLGGNRDLTPPKLRLEAGQLPALTKFLHEGARSFIGIHPGTEHGPAQRWPAERFAEAARLIADEFPCRWIIFGDPGEVALAADIERRLREAGADDRAIINVAGKTTLMELCQLLSCCKLVLTNDTGPMHLTAALGIPLVAVFGSTSPELTGPLGPHCAVVRGQAECAPCFLRECPIDLRCMQSISVAEVVAAALKLLKV
jgi:heptosyltransferase-2